MTPLDPIIFGDNQFFGVNHSSEEVAQSQQEKFAKLENIMKVLDYAYSAGIKAFMLNSNDRAGEICNYLRKNSDYWGGLRVYPSIPYPHKYVKKIVEEGIYKAFTGILTENKKSALTLLKGGISTVRKDIPEMMKSLIDLELQKYDGINIGTIFLQNIVTDLMLGLGMEDILCEFDQYIREKYKVACGFITVNLPMLVSALKKSGMAEPIVMSHYNKTGFGMNPSQKACEQVVLEENFQFVPMGIFASGSIPPTEALEYVFATQKIKSVIFGASSKSHIIETKNLITKFLEDKKKYKVID